MIPLISKLASIKDNITADKALFNCIFSVEDY